MRIITKKENDLHIKIKKMISPHAFWEDCIQEGRNLKAKYILIKVHEELKSFKPRKQYVCFTNSHTSYCRRIMVVRHGLEKKNYCQACHELENVLHFEQICEKRIFYNLLYLFEKYLYN